MSKTIEFSIDLIQEHSTGLLSIGGRCCKDTIAIGDVFTCMYTYDWPEFRRGLALDARLYLGIMNVRPIRLEVVQILMYGKPLDELDSGYTAEILFKGDTYLTVAEGDFLGGGEDCLFKTYQWYDEGGNSETHRL